MQLISGGSMVDALRRVAPGTALREALDNVIASRTGGLIVIGDPDAVDGLCDGGFTLDAPFTPQHLSELAKMDGAIILDDACRTIRKANVHLVPDRSLPTAETGMRHRTAERVGRQTGALVISVSQRRDLVTLYRGDDKVMVEAVEVVLAKANQALQTLQRFRSRLDELSDRLTTLEFDDAVSLEDVLAVLQMQLMVKRVASEVSRHVAELGPEGRLVRLQLGELTGSVEENHAMLVRDYAAEGGPRRVSSVRAALAALTRDELLDEERLANALGFPSEGNVLERHVRPRGYRVLQRIPMLPTSVADKLVERFGTLTEIMRASEAQLDEVDGVGARRARAIQEGLKRLREHGQL